MSEQAKPEENLDSLRSRIDDCDKQIVELINERATYARQIGEIKRSSNQAVYAPHRERAVYDKIERLNKGPLPARSVHAIYREIMSGTIALEGATRISYLGPPGTFSHMAALEKFGSSMEYIPAREIRDVFLAVNRGHADYGIVPIENSTEGAVTQTSDMLMETSLVICSEVYLPIHQNLLGNCDLTDVKIIASHPQPLAQCRNWLSANTAHVDLVETVSTAKAAELAAQNEGYAAIASEAAAGIYDLRILATAIEDRPDNITRFVVLSNQFGKATGNDRTSIMFSARHESGSLADTLQMFKRQGVNLTRIESRPCRKRNWEYTFFIDLEGHIENPNVAQAIEDLKPRTHDMVVLGSYPRGSAKQQ